MGPDAMTTALTLKQFWGLASYIVVGGGWMLAVLWLASRYVPGPSPRPRKEEHDADPN